MNAVKRIGLFVFSLAALFTLVALTLPWVGPWTKWATSLIYTPWYFMLLQGTVAITAIGALVALLRAIFAPRNAKSVIVSTEGGDQITVATSAISSQAVHVVEQNGDYVVEKVLVSARRRGRVRVAVRVRPAYAVNVTEEGARLHAELMEGLSSICGNAIERVSIEFAEPDTLESKPDYSAYTSPSESDVPEASFHLFGSAAPADAKPADEITVPMSTSFSSAETEADGEAS